MAREVEVKILGIDIGELKKTLRENHAVLVQPIEKQVRYVFDIDPKDKSKWIRLRTSRGKTTLAVKIIRSQEIDGTEEYEVTISDADIALKILRAMGFNPKSYQENYREIYKLGDAELSIDYWPRLSPYLEIESRSKKSIQDAITKLGLGQHEKTSVNTVELYRSQGINLDKLETLSFEGDEKDILFR